MVECDYRAVPADSWVSTRTNSNPVHFPVETMRPRFAACAADPDDRFRAPRPYAAHAIMNAESPSLIRVAMMGSLIDQCAHRLPKSIY